MLPYVADDHQLWHHPRQEIGYFISIAEPPIFTTGELYNISNTIADFAIFQHLIYDAEDKLQGTFDTNEITL
jgi:hypothetical protein